MCRKRERGVALLATLAVIALLASYVLVSRLNAESGGVAAANRIRNAAVLNQAKYALIGYVAQQAATAGERNPGRLPCPEAVNNIGTSSEGISAPWVGPPNTSTCASIGRLPWRTLGLNKLVDAANEPLWYVVGPVWRLTNSTSTLVINSNTAGDVLVDGQQVVALIIAPGAPMNVQASQGCVARNQSRGAPAPTMDARDYLECFDTATLQFATTAPGTSFNDQVIRVTTADIMPAIEAAIANRIEREIVPVLKGVYTDGAQWVTGFSALKPMFPYPAPFTNPTTASFQGDASQTAGLLPFNQTQGCTPASDPRCTATLMAWSSTGAVQSGGSGTIRFNNPCAWESADVFSCSGAYNAPTITLTLTATVTNVAMGLRAQDLSKVSCTAQNDVGGGLGTQNVPCSVTGVALQSNGSAIITVAGTPLPDIAAMGWGTWALFKISFDRALIGDHAILSSSDATTGWFVRNEWYRLLYYAPAAGHTAAALPAAPSCTTGATCLSVANVMPADAQRAILILAGRSINGSPRPSAALGDYLEFGNAKGTFERQTVAPATAATYTDTGTANAYVVSVASLAASKTVQFRAANANTGASTLTTAATGAKSLVNLDGSNFAASTIQANAVVQVVYDGTQFLLSKRPFNDRIVAIDSN